MAQTHRLEKLKSVEQTFNELASRLSRSANLNEDLNELPKIAEAYCSLKETIDTYKEWKTATAEHAEAQEIYRESASEPEMRDIAATEVRELEAKTVRLEKQLEILLYLRENHNMKNVLLEIRAVAGGEYGCIFAEDLVRMYRRYAESQNWKLELLGESAGDLGGFKEAILEIKGDSVYGKLKSEAGIHEAEAFTNVTFGSNQKERVAAMVKVMPEPEASELEIKLEDIEIRYPRAHRWHL